MNERTNTLLYKNISLTLYSRKGWCWLCVRGELETGTDFFWPLQHFFLILAGVAQLWVTESPKPSVCRWLSLWHLVSNWLQLQLKPSVPWLYYSLTPTCFHCSSTYLHRYISWLTARLRVNMLHTDHLTIWQIAPGYTANTTREKRL